MDELEGLRRRLCALDADPRKPAPDTPIVDGSAWILDMSELQLELTKLMFERLSALPR